MGIDHQYFLQAIHLWKILKNQSLRRLKSSHGYQFKHVSFLKQESYPFLCDASDRLQVPGAIAGPQLGDAAHRLVKNTLNIKLNNTSRGFLEQPPAHHTTNRFRAAGPSRYERYDGENTNGYYGQPNHHGVMARPRYPFTSNGGQNDRHNFRTQFRSQHQEQSYNVKAGFSALTMEEGVRPRSSRLPNSGPINLEPRFVQNMGRPVPPPKWITKAPPANEMYSRHQEAASGAVPYDKQTKVYQVKKQEPQDTPDCGN